ncbi:MAG: YbaB/EbfC family nucleoid-associated protein [Pseudomonadota bacterium]|nr:YbaB/EbfC family nucleoid-associated protein [Pseudomonadota bacterium]
MKNLGQLMKQAQAVQSKMADMQTKMQDAEVEGSSGGGMVVATVNGKGELKKLKIDPNLADPEDIEVLEDLVVAACVDAKARADAQFEEEMKSLTGGLPLPPGMKLF